MLAVLDKTTGHKARATLQIEGLIYTLGDFNVRVGKAVTKPNEEFKGIMLDVEYLPVKVAALAELALTVSLPHIARRSTPLLQNSVQDTFSVHALVMLGDSK